jgi:DNA adenine methylase
MSSVQSALAVSPAETSGVLNTSGARSAPSSGVRSAPSERELQCAGSNSAGPRRPFVKWAGGKRQLLPQLRSRVPEHHGRYFEPFVGGGALFFELRPAAATLTDVNERLIRTYLGVRDDVEHVIALLRSYEREHEQAFFYRLRDMDIDAETNAQVAAWFIYLNKVGFNGLYRVNRQNRFNVPFGRHKNPTICDEATLRACSAALAGATIEKADFEAAVASAAPGDLVYFDPPYVPLSVTSSFTSYTSSGFDSRAQIRLRNLALDLKRRGVHVLLSNSSAESVRELYKEEFTIAEVSATRLVNSKATGRGAITELVIT